MRVIVVLCSLAAGFFGYGSMWFYYSTTPAPLAIVVFAPSGLAVLMFALLQGRPYNRIHDNANARDYRPWLMFFATIGIYLATTLSGYNFYNHVSIELGNLMAYFGLALGLIFLSIQINLVLPKIFGTEN